MAKGLTKKQQRFVDEYLDGITVTDAMSLAGLEFQQVPSAGWYVYFLIDPRTDRIFYVGKGRRNRMYIHAMCASDALGNAVKNHTIKEIQSCGRGVIAAVFECFGREHDAYSVEARLIRAFKDNGLTNIARGSIDSQPRAQKLLNSMKPFEIWSREIGHHEWIERKFGSLRKFYDKFAGELRELITHPQKRVIHCGQANKVHA